MKELNKNLSSLLAEANIKEEGIELVPITFGGNNKTFKVCIGKKTYIFKEYFKHENDTRDRLLSEYSFLKYAKIAAPSWTPEPISWNKEKSCALYEFIEGVNYTPESVGREQVMEAAQFFVELNASDSRSFSNKLPLASESCFSIISHINLVNRRLEMLYQVLANSKEDKEALAFFENLKIRAENVIKGITIKSQELNIDMAEDLTPSERCVSPSDFGFHNAIKSLDGTAKFIDFEYAGWDDPAKMVGDFFAQLAVPISNKYFDEFANKCMAPFLYKDKLIKRSYLLSPLYKIKWCCIALNVLLPVNLARRKFANHRLDEGEIKAIQLTKARHLLNSLED